MSESDDRNEKLLERAEENRLVRKIILIALSVIIVLILGGAGFTYYFINHSLKPVDAANHKKVLVTIPPGTSNEGIGEILEKKGVVRSAKIFHYYCKYKNENGFMAGVYQLSPSMTIDEIINTIESGKTYTKMEFKLTIPEGYWVMDIAKRIAEKTGIKENDILAKMADRNYIKTHYMKDYPFLNEAILDKNIKYPLEGYLFPATYQLPKKNPDLDTIIKTMLDKTSAVLTKYQDNIKNSQLGSVHKVLTMASLVEGEADTETDRRKIAGVFYNRLNQKMPLQTDPTISYAEQRHIVSYTQNDLNVVSPYNTYKVKGLPVGPINNPSEMSILAVLDPIQSKYLYFYARPNGEVMYAQSLDEHNANVRKYQSEWDNVKGE
ncbi:MAG: endolytic transglycosylase MltG [Tuberibacillus sp.]